MDQPGTDANEVALRPFWQTALLFCGILGPVFFLTVYFIFGNISPDFDMMRQPIGNLELLKYGWIQSANFIVYGLFTCAFAVGLRNELQSGFGVNLLPLFHVFTALGMVLLGIFIHEPVHTYASVSSFVPLIISFILFACRFAGDQRWKGWATYTLLCAILMALLIGVYWYTAQRNNEYAGVFEHLVVFIRMIWLVTFVLKLLWGNRLTPLSRHLTGGD
jgi:hypothetical membrane protein